MPKRLNFQLQDAELVEIERAMEAGRRAEGCQRAAALCLLHQGKRVSEVAEVLAVTGATVYA